MTLTKAFAVLQANNAIAEGSFLYALHERDTFDRPTFWELYNALIIVGATAPAARTAQLRRDALSTYRNILMLIIWHFDPHDQSSIKRLPKGGRLRAYLERVEWGFHPLINGTRGYGWDQDFGDGLRNPRLAGLQRHFAKGKRR
jgi:hypothetical protein